MNASTRPATTGCSWGYVRDPDDEVLDAWLVKESVRHIYLAEDRNDAASLIDKAIAGCADDDVAEIVSLANTLRSWRTVILAHHDTGASNGPTERLKPLREEGQALRPQVPILRQLPAPRAPPRRRNHLAKPPITTTHQNTCSPLNA